MNFPSPSDKQAQVIWFSLTTLAVAVVLGGLGMTFWALGLLLNKLASLIVPLAIAGIIACLLTRSWTSSSSGLGFPASAPSSWSSSSASHSC